MIIRRPPRVIKSISLGKGRWENLMPIAAGTDMKGIALRMSDKACRFS